MIRIRVQAITVAVVVTMLGVGLAGCSASSAPTASDETAVTEAPAAPADLTGDWKQSNSKSTDSYQAATIEGTTIEINWVTDGGATKSLYWAGSYDAPMADGSFSWDSTNDTSKTDMALLASSDATKTFSYDNGIISYEVSALGTTTTVELKEE